MNSICIVEDEELIARDWELSLKENGYDVCSIARDHTEALYAAVHYKPNFFLMDINVLGEIDGIQIAAWIQEFHETHIIFHSLDSPFQHKDRLKKIKYLDFLEKPASEQELFKILNRIHRNI